MRIHILAISLCIPIPSLADEPAAFVGFAMGKDRYFALTELPDATIEGARERRPNVQQLHVYYEFKRGSGSLFGSFEKSEPSNCTVLRSSYDEWLRVDCRQDARSPLGGVTYELDGRESLKNGDLVLRCTQGCRTGVPALLRRFVPIEGGD